MCYRRKILGAAVTLATFAASALFPPQAAGQNSTTPPNVGIMPSPPSVHLACTFRKISSGLFAANFGIYARNATRQRIAQRTRIKWKVRFAHGTVNKPVFGQQSPYQTQSGEFVVMSREGLRVGEEVEVAQVMAGSTPKETWTIIDCQAEI